MTWRTVAWALLIVQVATYWRLGVSQALLAAVQALIYSGGLG